MAEWWEELEDEPADDWMAEYEDAPVEEVEEVAEAPEQDLPWYLDTLNAIDTGLSQTGGAIETVGALASGAAGEVMGGVRGAGVALGSALAGDAGPGAMSPVDKGVAELEATRDAMTYEPMSQASQDQMQAMGETLAPVGEAFGAAESFLGEGTMALTGSPELAAAAHSAPTAILEFMGLGTLKRTSRAAEAARRVREENSSISDSVLEPEMRTDDEVIDGLRKRDVSQTVEDVRPDAEILAAAEDLGISLNPSHYSTNEAYKRVEQAMKSRPDSKLSKSEEAAIKALAVKGDELIKDIDGDVDRGLLDADLKERIDTTVDAMTKRSDDAYKRVDETIPAATKVAPKNVEAFVSRLVEDFGGDVSLLAPIERRLYDLMQRDKPPTYRALDRVRRDIGDGYKGKGVYKDEASGTLDAVYSVLIEDQQNAANAAGVGAEFALGRRMVQKRKNVEKRSVKMFGRDVDKSILPKLTASATKMTKGDVSEFKNLMEALPEDMRQRAAATMLNDLFNMGARNKAGGVGAGFANAYDALERNKSAKKELFKYLPKDAQRRFDSIGKVSRGIYRAKALENTSRTARDILMALESGGMVSRLVDRALDTVLGRATFAPGATRWVASGAQAAKRGYQEATNAARAADELMASPKFEKALAKAMEGKVKEAETMLKRSDTWRKFRSTLGEGTAEQLRAMGAIAWLTQPPQQEAPPDVQ